MSSNEQTVVDVNQSNFEEIVLNAPDERVIIVDFWAPWCSPCRMLGPILEQVVASFHGEVVLAKVNVDENQSLAMQYRVQGIPAVKFFQGGKVVDEFTGALPEQDIQRRLESFVSTQSDERLTKAQSFWDGGALDLAEAQYKEILKDDPGQVDAKLALAKIQLEKHELTKAYEYAKSIEIGEKHHEEAQGIMNHISFLKECGEDTSKTELKKKLEADEGDLDARYHLACCYAAEEEYQLALEEFLTVLKKDKKYKDGAAKDAMVRIFTIIGQRSQLADDYRDKMEWLLY